MHPDLIKKLDNYDFLYHSCSLKNGCNFLERGFARDIFATIDRSNDFHEEVGIYFLIDRRDIFEDPCLEEGTLVNQEWDKHDQVYLPMVDFFENANIIEIKTKSELIYRAYRFLLAELGLNMNQILMQTS